MFKLSAPTLSIEFIEGHRILFTIPENAIVRLHQDVDKESGDGLIGVTWQGHLLMMFASDLQERGTRMFPAASQSVNASGERLRAWFR
jgi:hypothetical protein